MVEYLACGNIMSDFVERADGTIEPMHMGGPAFFALTGIRLWSKSCKLVCQAGADYEESYGKWMTANGLSCDGINVAAEKGTQHFIKHNEDGTYDFRSRFGQELLGYLKTRPEDIERALTPGVKGVYMAQNVDRIYWQKLRALKEKYEFKFMWELEGKPSYLSDEEWLPAVKRVIADADMWSLNSTEASILFGIPKANEEDIINEIMKMPVEMTLFRVGKKGAYAVSPSNAVFCPSIDITESVDPTGCGNCSTGAAMYAHLAGHSLKEVAVMANISAGYNAAQFGPFMQFTDEVMENAQELRKKYVASL